MADVIWDSESRQVSEYFNEYVSKYYPNFGFTYNWNDYPEIKDYLIRLFLSSCSNNIHTTNDGLLASKIPTYIRSMEYFFETGIELGLFNEHTLPRIMKSLKRDGNGLRVIEFLPENFRGVYGQSIGNAVQVNPEFKKHIYSPSLTPDELTRLYLYHEVGHKILNVANNDKTIKGFSETIDNVLESKGVEGVDTNFTSFIPEGFNMIEECLTQEMAEIFTYYSLGKERPPYSRREDMGAIHKTNLDFYGIFQTPTVELGRTLRGCDSGYSSDRRILYNMIAKALYNDFADELIGEYNEGDGSLYYDLFKTLRSMGILKQQKYASFGLGKKLNISPSDLLKAIETITYKNIDNRPYPASGFKPVDFENFKYSKYGAGAR